MRIAFFRCGKSTQRFVRWSGTFRKAFTIDERIDRDKIGAVHTNGVMTLTLHVKEAVKPRRIAISTK